MTHHLWSPVQSKAHREIIIQIRKHKRENIWRDVMIPVWVAVEQQVYLPITEQVFKAYLPVDGVFGVFDQVSKVE